MRLKWMWIIFLKEMLDLLRDRKTIISMIIVPALSTPGIVLGMKYFVQKSQKEIKAKTFVVSLYEKKKLEGIRKVLKKEGFKIQDSKTPKQDVLNKKAQVGIEIIPSPKLTTPTPKIDIKSLPKKMEAMEKILPAPIQVRIFIDRAKFEGKLMYKKINTSLQLYRGQEVNLKLALQYQVDFTKLMPFKIENVNLASPKKMAGMVIGQVLGYFIIIMMLSGGMYAAIDMTAGEKERKTLEMLLSSPASREEIVLGKVGATIVVTFVTALLTLLSFGITFYFIKGDPAFTKVLGGVKGIPIDFLTMALLTFSVLPVAVLSSSLTLLISTLAKSFKEAQSYLTPLVMAAIFPAMVSFIPGIELDWKMACIPVVNFSLFIKELLLGEWVWLTFGITVFSNFVYAGIAFLCCVQIFKNEKVLFRM